jgi:subtilisin family serine protease
MLSGSPLSEIILPFSEDGIPPDQPIATTTDNQEVATFDQGEFYYVDQQQIPLRRIADHVLIRVEPSADPAAVVSALTGSGGSLEGFVPTYLDTRLIQLAAPPGHPPGVLDDELAAAAPQDGVQWSAPVFSAQDGGGVLWLDGQLVVALNDGVDPNDFFATGYSTWQQFFDNQYIATPDSGGALGALNLANQLSTDSRVEWATPNFFTDYSAEAVPNDPLFNSQWTMNNTGQFGARNGADAKLVNAWDTTMGSQQIVIAILDNGVQLNHPDLAAHIFTNTGEIPGNGIDDDGNGFIDDVHGWDFAGPAATNTPDNDPNPTTQFDNHGTAVAGIAAAVGNNMVGVSGAAQRKTNPHLGRRREDDIALA